MILYVFNTLEEAKPPVHWRVCLHMKKKYSPVFFHFLFSYFLSLFEIVLGFLNLFIRLIVILCKEIKTFKTRSARYFVISTCQKSSFSWQYCLRSDWFALPHDAQYMARPSASPRQRPPRSSNPLSTMDMWLKAKRTTSISFVIFESPINC